MRPTFMGFETAKSAVFTNQKSLDIVGNNLANINTPGYTRQRVERTAISQSTFSNRVSSNRIGLAGQGVESLGVSQMRDAFLDKCFRDEYSKASYHGQAASILSSIQSTLTDGNDITSSAGIQGAIEQLYSGLNQFINEPTLDSGANIVMSAFKNICHVLNQLDEQLQVVTNQQIDDLRASVTRVNEITSAIAHLNDTISKDAASLNTGSNEHFKPNELLDQRNQLLDELASYGNIKVTELANGTVSVEMGGHKVVNGNSADSLTMNVSDEKLVSINWRTSGDNIRLSAGSMLADLHFINGRGSNIQSKDESTEQGIPYYRDRLDSFAHALASFVNSSVPEYDPLTDEPRTDADGKIIYKTLLSASSYGGAGDGRITAASISLSTEWIQGGAGYFIYNRDESVEDYAQKMASTLVDEKFTFQSYGESFTGTFAEYNVEMLGRLGTDLQYQEGRHEASATVADDFLERRDQIAGVSQDEETADMLRYQRSYEAAARLMTILDEVLDVLINRMGRVGL